MTLFFLGGGHGGVAALRSLQATFSNLEIFSTDPNILILIRERDRKCKSLEDVRSTCGVTAGYMQILPEAFFSCRTVINIHYSLLPQYRGLHSLVWAMLNLETQVGLTLHVVNANIDDGPIIYQHRITYADETSAELMLMMNEHVSDSLGRIMTAFLDGKITSTPQNKLLATWVPKRNFDDCIVNFDWPAPRLRALFRALVFPYPLPSIWIKGIKYEINEAEIVERKYFCDSGRVVNVDGDGAWIKCADSLLVVRRLVDSDNTTHDAQSLLYSGMRLSKNLL